MKHHPTLLLAAIALLGLPAAGNAAATLTQAQLTLIIKDVKTIDPGKGARPAAIRETVEGRQAVRTGIESRTELFFNDKSITRLGANTHFSFQEGTRDMSLQNGAMLLQVPKGIGGAKIETPAVTAGITGTTIMLYSDARLTKFIVLEGNGFLMCNAGKWKGVKVWAHAGQEIIFFNVTGKIPPPVFINLKLLEKTSLLLTGKWGVFLNMGPILAAANDQPAGKFVPLNSTGGAGADTVVTLSKLPQNPGSQAPPPPPNSPPPPPPAPSPPPRPPTIR